jgi:hypothetical protein
MNEQCVSADHGMHVALAKQCPEAMQQIRDAARTQKAR